MMDLPVFEDKAEEVYHSAHRPAYRNAAGEGMREGLDVDIVLFSILNEGRFEDLACTDNMFRTLSNRVANNPERVTSSATC